MERTIDGLEILQRDDGVTLFELRVFVARHQGYFGTGLTAQQAEDSFKNAGGDVRGLRKLGTMKLLPPGITHHCVDGFGSPQWRGIGVKELPSLKYVKASLSWKLEPTDD